MISRFRYLGILGAITLGTVATAAMINWVVDPYAYFRVVRLAGLNVVKPRPDHDLREIKRAGVRSVRPDALILGNSRAEVGFDPEHPAWSARGLSAYNFALPGTTVATARAVLDVEAREFAPKLVVIGVEFLDFLVDPAAPGSPAPVVGRASPWGEAVRLAKALFTWNALVESVETLGIQRNPHAPTITSRGFNPLREYAETARIEGYYALFRQRAAENAAQYVRRPRSVRLPDGRPGPAFDNLRALVRAAVARDAEVQLIIYPYHAQLLLMFEESGLWPAFEDWKRLLGELVAEEVGSGQTAKVTLWDFSGFSRYSTEAIPPPNDRATAVQWYWEGGHFKRELGDLILDQILGHNAEGFGTRLDKPTIDRHLASLTAQRDAFRASQPALAAEVRDLVLRGRAKGER